MKLHEYLTRQIRFGLLPVLVFAVGLACVAFAREVAHEAEEARRLAELLARGLDQTLQSRIGALKLLAGSPLVEENRWPQLYDDARKFRDDFGGQVILVDAERRLRLHSGVPFGSPLPSLPHATGRRAVALAFESARPVVGDPYPGVIAGEPVVAIAVPVLRGSGVQAVLANVMPVGALRAKAEILPLPAGWNGELLDSDGRPILRRVGEQVAASGGDNGAGFMRFTHRSEAVPWTVELAIPHALYWRRAVAVAAVLLLTLLAATAASMLVGQRGARRLEAAVRSLASPPETAAVMAIDEIHDVRRRLDEAIAQRQASADALAVREGQLRGIFESASEAIITVDARQDIVLANPAAARAFGHPVERLAGMALAQLIPERFRTRHRDDVDAFGREEAGPRPMGRPDVVGQRADGSEFPIEAAISQVHLDGQHLYTVILRDVSERRRTEAEIALGKARLETTIGNMRDGLVMVDSEERILEVNAAFARMHGFAGKDECPRSIADCRRALELSELDGRPVPPDQWCHRLALRGEAGSGVERWVRRAGTDHAWVGSFSFAPIHDAQARVTGAVVTVRDVTERLRLESELKASHADLARLVSQQQNVEEAERRRIARELHDELQQVLAAIKIDIGAIEAALASDPAQVASLVERIDDLATAAITSSRRIVNDLRPLLLEELGLVAALEALARRFAERMGVGVKVVAGERVREPDAVPDAIAICLYRVAQEALNNVAKHAGARRVELRVDMPEDGGWQLEVSDDGRGMQPSDRLKPMSLGLRGMAERVRALGGTLSVRGVTGRGVSLVAAIPPQPTE